MKKYCYFNGKIISFAKASLPLNDMSILRGYAAFDFLRTYKGKLFCFQDYFRRFVASAKELNLKVPLKEKEVETIIYDLLKKNKCKDASIRLVLTGGVSPNGFDLGEANFFILLEDPHEPPAQGRKQGVKLVTRNYERAFASAKTTSYMFPIREKIRCKKEKAFEVLYVLNNVVFECSFSNIFFFKDAKLITPKDGVLKGITRQKVIELAKRQKKHFVVEEREVTLDEVLQADEVFITGSNKRVLPITKIDTHTIANGKVGMHTKLMMKLFEDFTQG